MSKYVKQLVADYMAKELEGVEDALLVNVIGLEVNTSNRLRGHLEEKNIRLMVVKNSLARRAFEGSPLSIAFEGLEGSTAIVWGADDFVSLAKEIVRLSGEKEYEKLEYRVGVMDGERLSTEQVEEISKWPSRAEQLSLLVGQVLSPGAALSSQLIGGGGALASQIEKIGEGEGKAEEGQAEEQQTAE